MLGAGVSACPACGEPIADRRSGFETVSVPAKAAAEPDLPVDAPSTGTTLLHEASTAQDPDALGLKLQAQLILRGGSRSGERLKVACPTTTVGRTGEEIRVDDPALSGRHFRIEERGHEFFLRDLGSTNGTFLNGHLVRSAPLKPGDEIQAGESLFVFSVVQVIACD